MTGGVAIDAARAALDRDGFVILRGAVERGWIDAHRNGLCSYVARHRAGMDEAGRAVGTSAVAPTFTLGDAPPDVAAFVTDARLGALAAALLAVRSVRLLHYCGFFKPPAGRPTPWHRDQDFLPLDTDRLITAWLPLVEIDATMGMLAFAHGSHRDPRSAEAFARSDSGPLSPGDVSFHLGGTLHAAGGNRSDRMRAVMAMTFYPDGVRIRDDEGVPFRAALRAHHFADLAPGELAAGPANPLVHAGDPPEGR